MTPLHYQHQLRLIKHHYQRLQYTLACLLIILCLQSFFLLGKHERIVIHPPELTQHYWIEGNRFSPSYIEEMAKYMCHLMLDATPDSMPLQGQILLRYALPKAYGALKAQIASDVIRLKQQQLCLNFIPKAITLNTSHLTAYVTGELHRYVGTKRIDSEQTTWKVVFHQRKGRLFLKTFESTDQQEATK
jgi:conjugal transfer pilus assembly protein TraE